MSDNIDISDVEELEVVEETSKLTFISKINTKLRNNYFLIGEPKIVINDGVITYIQTMGRKNYHNNDDD